MDYQIIWSPEALDDIDAIAEFIQKSDPYYAQTVVEQLIVMSRKLNQFPLRGRVVPELNDDCYREVFVHSYRLIYRVDGRKVAIAAAVPGKMPLDVERFEH